jgi:hypothetical protein
VNRIGPANTARIASPAEAKPATSPCACSGVTRPGLVTMAPYSNARPAVLADSTGTSGLMPRAATRMRVNRALS